VSFFTCAQLRGRTREQRLREHGIGIVNQRMICEIGIAHRRGDFHAAIGRRFDIAERQAANVDHALRLFDVELHQVEQRSTDMERFR
jgi:hypothetical protein